MAPCLSFFLRFSHQHWVLLKIVNRQISQHSHINVMACIMVIPPHPRRSYTWSEEVPRTQGDVSIMNDNKSVKVGWRRHLTNKTSISNLVKTLRRLFLNSCYPTHHWSSIDFWSDADPVSKRHKSRWALSFVHALVCPLQYLFGIAIIISSQPASTPVFYLLYFCYRSPVKQNLCLPAHKPGIFNP